MEDLLLKLQLYEISKSKHIALTHTIEQRFRKYISLADYKISKLPAKKKARFKQKVHELEQIMVDLTWNETANKVKVRPSKIRKNLAYLSELGIFSQPESTVSNNLSTESNTAPMNQSKTKE